ncbi:MULTISPECIES: hypothetical protein [unclassified Novosphingobium]|uniref:hypothetical protein n=1 Tax=unclassified Novosphingobium TaxID=2644732 RepID=UPI0006CD2D0A|nr:MULTISPECIES: hypothetical protein [unclassified Novosphingobium]KPH66329.1 hypothetical protein ADT71_06580 [Novosphingobium sp. ST904]TCM42092.1 hypothetical protein EDF59_10253 [Novosphingobium sp. ST904]WRT91361.1 hypothetical protein U9J33_08965 [Novosphingobium sp. RL4]
MASQTSVANLALMFIGTETRLLSIDDEKDAARSLKAVWDILREGLIRRYSWNWATRRAALPAEAITVSPPFTHSFRLPAQAIRLIEVFDASGKYTASDYQLEGRSVLTARPGPLYVRCLMDIAEIAEWDPLAAIQFAGNLALTCGNRIAGSAFDKALTMQRYREAVADAQQTDALENPPIEVEESAWVEARITGGFPTAGLPGWEIS